MTYALSLILWMATAQASAQPTVAPVIVPATAIIQCVPSDTERALRAQVDEARGQLEEARAQLDEARERAAKLEAESGMADNAVAALLLSDRPELASLRLRGSRFIYGGAGKAQIDIYVPARKDVKMVAVVVNLRNRRDEKTWEPTKAWLTGPIGPKLYTQFHLLPPMPIAVRSAPQRILPGQSARIVVVFDKTDLEATDEPVRIGIQRDDVSELEFELTPPDLQPTSETGG